MSKASLPEHGYTPPNRIVDPSTPLKVAFVAEGGLRSAEFDFSRLPVAEPLQRSFAAGFIAITGPAGTRRTVTSAGKAFRHFRAFSVSLAASSLAPTNLAELRPSHLDSFKMSNPGVYHGVVSTLRSAFRKVDGCHEPFLRKLFSPSKKGPPAQAVDSYSPEHHRLVIQAAVETVREAHARIRQCWKLVDGFRDGSLAASSEDYETARMLDRLSADANASMDVRTRSEGPRNQSSLLRNRLLRRMHLRSHEAGALAFLLMAHTGQNKAQIISLPAQHHRADSQHEGSIAVAQVRASKPRRGAAQSEMTLTLAELPAWMGASDERVAEATESTESIDLRSAFGAYSVALKLTSYARALTGSTQLLMYYGVRNETRGSVIVPGHDRMVDVWLERVDIIDSKGDKVRPNTRRLRQTYIERKQRPVAHSVTTFTNTYLKRDRGNILEYQKIVSQVLDSEVARAHEYIARVISPAAVELAQSDLLAAAALTGTAPATLSRALSGELDTVMTSCVDNDNSPYSPPGSPCGASFMLCLGCPNARAEPRHLPVQLLVLEGIEVRRLQMDALRWAERFALAHARLTNLISQFPQASVEAARGRASDEDKALVVRFLGRELDTK